MSRAPSNKSNVPAKQDQAPPPMPADAVTMRKMLEGAKDRLVAALPRHLSAERMIQVVSTMIYRTPRLAECDRASVFAAVMQSGELGLDLSPAMGEAYLIPRWNGKARVLECQFQPGYRGLVKLAMQSGGVANIHAEIVREGDVFEWWHADGGLHYRHVPEAWNDDRPVIGVYAIAKRTNGEIIGSRMSVREVEAIRSRSQAGGAGPWVSDWNEMARKTILRRLCKALPQSTELSRAIEADEAEYREGPRVVVSAPPGAPQLQQPQQSRSEQLIGMLTGATPEPAYEAEHGVKEPVRSEAPAPAEDNNDWPDADEMEEDEKFNLGK
jgi:recombination protein RecT